MKIRKILPLVILAVGAVLLLSGCDAMLDAIFPNTQIVVDASVYGPYHPGDWSFTYNSGQTTGKITVVVTDTNSGQVYQGYSYWNYADLSYVYYNEIAFSGLKDHTYQVVATYTSLVDHNGYSQVQVVSPATDKSHTSTVAFTF